MSASSVAIASRDPAGREAIGWRRRWAISSSRCTSAASSCSTSVVVEGGVRRVSLRPVATSFKHARRIASTLLVTCHCSGEDSTDTAPTLATSGPFFLIHSGYVTLRQRGEIPTTSMTDAPPAHDRAVEATCTGARPSDPDRSTTVATVAAEGENLLMPRSRAFGSAGCRLLPSTTG